MIWKPACLALIGIVGTGDATAAPYWIAYEGNDFPENVGWTRIFGDEGGTQQGGAARQILDGVLRLDSSRTSLIYDYYEVNRSIDPEVGEAFICEWRLRVESQLGPLSDVGVTIARDEEGTLGFRYFADRVVSLREGWSVPINPLIFHTYRVYSTDMLNYSFFVDGSHVRDGVWDWNSINHSFVNFGDGGFGGNITSVSEWDYFSFGVVPEPNSLVGLGLAAALWSLRRA